MTKKIVLQPGWMQTRGFRSVECEPLSVREIWLWMLEHAAHYATTTHIGHTEVAVPKGAFLHSVRQLSDAWGCSTGRAQRVIARLGKAGMIQASLVQNITMVSICNYDEYCPADTLAPAPERRPIKSPPKTHPIQQQRHKTKESIPYGIDNASPTEKPTTRARARGDDDPGASPPRARAKRLPSDFEMPGSWIAAGYAVRAEHELPEVDLNIEKTKFISYYRGLAGPQGASPDWQARWIKWALDAKGSGNGRRPGGQQFETASERSARLSRERLERIQQEMRDIATGSSLAGGLEGARKGAGDDSGGGIVIEGVASVVDPGDDRGRKCSAKSAYRYSVATLDF